MAVEDQGIMSLPMEDEAAAQTMPQMPLEESYDAVKQGLATASPQAATDVQKLMQSITPQLDQLSDEELNTLLQMVQYLYEGGETEYAKRLQEVIAGGALDAGDLPEEFDPEILSSIGAVLMEAIRTRQGAMAQEPMPPAQFAQGGIADAARIVAGRGRSGDTMLAHINPEEARLLRSRGGMGTINPKTGLPEYGIFSSIGKAIKGVFKAVVGAVKSIIKSPIGKILATVALAAFLGPGALGVTGLGLGTAALPLASGIVTLAGGGNLKQALVAGATAYFGAPGGAVSQYVGAAGITNVAANAAITAGIVGTGAGLLTGQKLSDAVKSGLTAGAVSGLATGFQQGFTTGNAPRTDAGAPVEDRTSPLTPEAVARGTAAPVTAPAAAPVAASGDAALAAFQNAQADPFGGYPPAAQAAPLSGQAAPAVTATGAPAGTATARVPGAVPGFMESATRTAGGIGDLIQGKEGAFETIKQGAADMFMPKTYTAAELQNTDVFRAAREAGATYSDALKQAGTAYNPSTLRAYAPMVGAGLGVAGLMGGFTPNQPPPSALAAKLSGTPGLDLINKNPSQYLVQGLPGVQYSSEGNITGSSPYAPSATMADVQVATPNYGGPSAGMAQRGPVYTPGPGTMGFARGIGQPGNTPAMYGNLMSSTGYDPYGYFRAAEGGLASLANGGYPRKTGAISGPGTEKSDSIPAMLSDGEFVMTAKAVRGIGSGSRRAGAKKMYALMHQLERNASRG